MSTPSLNDALRNGRPSQPAALPGGAVDLSRAVKLRTLNDDLQDIAKIAMSGNSLGLFSHDIEEMRQRIVAVRGEPKSIADKYTNEVIVAMANCQRTIKHHAQVALAAAKEQEQAAAQAAKEEKTDG